MWLSRLLPLALKYFLFTYTCHIYEKIIRRSSNHYYSACELVNTIKAMFLVTKSKLLDNFYKTKTHILSTRRNHYPTTAYVKNSISRFIDIVAWLRLVVMNTLSIRIKRSANTIIVKSVTKVSESGML